MTSRTLSLLAACIASSALADQPGRIDFRTQIAPIFETNCYDCHSATRFEGGLRLDAASFAKSGGDSGPAFIAGKSAESYLIDRVAADEGERMPPEGPGLTVQEIERLKRWIDQGADWPETSPARTARSEHWSFQPPKRSPLPDVRDSSKVRNPIDRFVLARLEENGLTLSEEADKYALIRRAYLDFLGVLPTPEEADAFVADASPDAYERLIDRLLASPKYGERWARPWLDLARYADTNGYEKDRPRSIWPYRDWVVDALNADMPFDRFTIEQLAGDLLPDATLSQRIATGFHRNTMINEEGGIDVEEFRYHAVVDRTATTGTVWLGLTVGCAQCHTHKYDPITQREFFQLSAFFDNADEPEIQTPDPAIERRRQEILQDVAAKERELESRFPELQSAGAFSRWEAESATKSSHWTVAVPEKVESEQGATLTVLPDGSVLASGDNPNYDTYRVVINAALPRVTGIRLEALPHESLPAGGPGRAVFDSGAGAKGDFLLGEFVVESEPPPSGTASPLQFSDAQHSHALEKRSAEQTVDGDLDTGWSIGKETGRPHHAVYSLAEPIEGEARLTVTLHQRYIHQMTLGRFRLSLTGDESPLHATGLPADVEEILVAAPQSRTSAQTARLRSYYVRVAPELKDLHEQIAELRSRLPEHPTTMVMQERPQEHRRQTRIRNRGEFLQPRDAVETGTPAVLPPLPSDAAADRLTLARWLVSDDNPLTARVTMNRHWAAFFGRGLVRTVEDFGTQGEPPTHPRLLDWLAVEFMERGWSVKAMHRLIATSATYRQSSAATRQSLEADPDNRWLSRAPRQRLDAELLRDMALSASGSLSDKMGGPSVFPPQPEGVTRLAYGQSPWTVSEGEDRYRRGLYTFAKRTAPYAAFATFDAPSGEACVPFRSRSNTPLQALTTLNDSVFVDAARHLASQSIADVGDCGDPQATRSAVASRMIRRCLTRPPEADQIEMLCQFQAAQAKRFRSGELDAAAALGISNEDAGEPETERLSEMAAWTAVARVLLNLDQTIVRE